MCASKFFALSQATIRGTLKSESYDDPSGVAERPIGMKSLQPRISNLA